MDSKPIILSIRTLKDILLSDKEIKKSSPSSYSYIIDVSQYRNFVRPLFIVCLTQFIMINRSVGYVFEDIILEGDSPTLASEYFKGIGLKSQFINNFTQREKLNNSYKTSLPILIIPKEYLDQEVERIINFFRNQDNAKDFTLVKTYLSELINNCYDHAESKTGVVVYSQFYRQSGIIKFAVCDTGIGIVNRVNAYHIKNGKEPLLSEDAINWALVDENTTQSTPNNRGRGLATLSSSIKYLDGEVWLLTNDKGLFISHKKEEQIKKFHPSEMFHGTAFEIGIKLSNLDELEEGDLDFYL